MEKRRVHSYSSAIAILQGILQEKERESEKEDNMPNRIETQADSKYSGIEKARKIGKAVLKELKETADHLVGPLIGFPLDGGPLSDGDSERRGK